MEFEQLRARLSAADRPPGGETRDLLLGGRVIRIEGLDPELAAALERRWGDFLVPTADHGGAPTCRLRLLRGGRERWLDGPAEGGLYRLESVGLPDRRLIVSAHFALAPDPAPPDWKAVLTEQAPEPRERMLDNVARVLAAKLALAAGGFALHAAGVARAGRAYLFAGPSRAGKSTATRLAAPARSLGDDFGLVVRDADGSWQAPALPFDNAERIVGPPQEGLLPVAGIWRLFQAAQPRRERPLGAVATASLMACAAFPWVLADQAELLLSHVHAFVATGRFGHLHFNRESGIWHQLDQD